jgi:hypothetical protein
MWTRRNVCCDQNLHAIRCPPLIYRMYTTLWLTYMMKDKT